MRCVSGFAAQRFSGHGVTGGDAVAEPSLRLNLFDQHMHRLQRCTVSVVNRFGDVLRERLLLFVRAPWKLSHYDERHESIPLQCFDSASGPQAAVSLTEAGGASDTTLRQRTSSSSFAESALV